MSQQRESLADELDMNNRDPNNLNDHVRVRIHFFKKLVKYMMNM